MRKPIAIVSTITAASAAFVMAALADTDKTYDFTGFDELDIAAGVEVSYETGDHYSVVAHFRQGGPDDMKIRQDGDRLYISKKAMSGWGNKLRVTLNITSPELNAIEASSGSSIRASGVNAGSFALKVSSGGSAEVSGTCKDIAVKASSGGNADARDLKCESATASASSGGSVEAYASVRATSSTSSGGNVDIWGNPADRTVNNSISGGNTDFH